MADIFSGEQSIELWAAITAVQSRYPLVWEALYSLGCRCQELEVEVEKLKAAVGIDVAR